MAQKRIPEHLQAWIDARKYHKLLHAHAHMARELGMNPRKLGKLDGKERPEVVLSIEERARIQQVKKAARKEAKQQRLEGHPSEEGNKDSPAGD